jgi:hypothetical protein
LEKIEEICKDFELRRTEIDEFQSRLGMLIFEDEFHRLKEKIIDEAQNSLELIRFTQADENHYNLGMEVAQRLIAEIKEFEQAHKVRRYVDDSIK